MSKPQVAEPQNMDDYVARKARDYGRSRSVTFIPEPEPEPLFCPMISADDHVLEPPSLFEGRLPTRLADRAPRIEVGEMDVPWWVIDGEKLPIILVNGASGRDVTEWGVVASTFEEIRQASWDPRHRLHDMDLTGVWASLCFGSTIWGFAGTRFSKLSDPEVGLACLRAYNDWMIEEWCGTSMDRFIPCQLPWLRDPQVAAGEIRRNAGRGFKAVSFSENPEGLGFPNVYDPSWNPFFEACEETETVVNLHVGSSGTVRRPCSSSPEPVGTALFPVSGLEALVDWIYAGVPVRFPGITIALSEAGVSWVPMALERLRRAHRRETSVMGKGWPGGSLTPEEIVGRNFVFTSIEDPAGFRLLDLIGDTRVMVETDYPHFDSTWPECQAMIRSELDHLPPAVIRKVCYQNAARIYRHPLPPTELIASSEVGLS